MERARRGDMDFIKGLLMFFVVWGHLCAYCVDNSNYTGKVLTCYTTLFQMPLFLFVSGFFQKEVTNIQDYYKHTKKSIIRSGLPYITYCVLSIILIMLRRSKDGQNQICLDDIRGVSSVFWFFITLIACVIINNTASLLGVLGGGKKWIIIAIQICLMLIPSNMYYLSFLFLFFIGGSIFRNRETQIDGFFQTKKGKVLLVFFIVLFLVGGWLFPRDYTFYSMLNTLYENWWLLLYRYILYSVATISVLMISRKLYLLCKGNKILLIFQEFGKHTLTVYAGHLLIIYYIIMPNNITILEGGILIYYVFIPIVAIGVLFSLSGVERLLSEHKFLRLLFLGLK